MTPTFLKHKDSSRTFGPAIMRTWLAALLFALPLAVVMLIPALMRSRVEAPPGLSWVGIALFLSLSALGAFLSPTMSAVAAPVAQFWRPGTARKAVSEFVRPRPRLKWRRRGEFLALFIGSQLAGSYVAWLMPYIWRNPEAASNPSAPVWALSYTNYALQAITMYLIICFAFAWYGSRLRNDIIAEHKPTR